MEQVRKIAKDLYALNKEFIEQYVKQGLSLGYVSLGSRLVFNMLPQMKMNIQDHKFLEKNDFLRDRMFEIFIKLIDKKEQELRIDFFK